MSCAVDQVSVQRRRVWLMKTLLGKLVARGGALRQNLKKAFVKFDRNGSGELDMEEFRLAMDEHLPGIDDEEFLDIARSFDEDGDGVVSIEEFVRALANLDNEAPGGHFEGATKEPQRRRPRASGTAYRATCEFVDDGQNQKGNEKDPDLLKFFADLGARAGGALLEALKREKSTKLARHLTLAQFTKAIGTFYDQKQDFLPHVDTLYKKCYNGDFMKFMDLMDQYSHHADDNMNNKKFLLPKKTTDRSTLKLKYLLLDKIDEKAGNSFRVKLKRAIGKYDVDNSGELDRFEFEKAFAELLPGVDAEKIDDLLKDMDLNDDGLLSLEEVAKSLLLIQEDRNQSNVSLKFNRKQPLYTKAGARGLA